MYVSQAAQSSGHKIPFHKLTLAVVRIKLKHVLMEKWQFEM